MKTWPVIVLCAATLVLRSACADARDLTIVSYGGSLQDAVRQAFAQPFSELAKTPALDVTYDGTLAAIVAEVKAGAPNWDVVNVGAQGYRI